MKWLRSLVALLVTVMPSLVLAISPPRAVDLGPTSTWIEAVLGPAQLAREHGIWIDLRVDSGETVAAGQTLAVQLDVRGRVVQEYTASAAGRVTISTRASGTGAVGTILEISTSSSGGCVGRECPITKAH